MSRFFQKTVACRAGEENFNLLSQLESLLQALSRNAALSDTPLSKASSNISLINRQRSGFIGFLHFTLQPRFRHAPGSFYSSRGCA